MLVIKEKHKTKAKKGYKMSLTKEQLKHFKDKLLKMRNHLQRSMESAHEQVKSDETHKGYSQHQADEGTDDFDQMVTLGVSERESKLLQQVVRALEKVEEGSYGICDMTSEEIPLKRLEAIPYAVVTIQVQERLEKGKM